MMIKSGKTKAKHPRKRSTNGTSPTTATSKFGERNIRPRKRLLADDYLYCDTCQRYNNGLCPRGCQTYEANRRADHAKHTTPSGIQVARSNIASAGLGVFAMKEFAENTFFGPYTGDRHRSAERANQSGYAWTIEDAEGNTYNYVDASDSHRSNWLRYVNCPLRKEDENLIAIQFNGELYYRTSRDIQAGEELLVYYGEEYAKALGIRPFEQSMATDTVEPPSPTSKKEQQLTARKKSKRSKETLSIA